MFQEINNTFVCNGKKYRLKRVIKNILTRRKENDTYLAPVAGVRRGSLPLQLMKATVLAESYYISYIFIIIYGLQRCLLTVAR